MWRRQPWPQRGDGSPDVSFTLRLACDYSRFFGTTSTRSSVPPAMHTGPPTSYLPWSCTSHLTRRFHISKNLMHPSRSNRSAMERRSFIPRGRKSRLPLKWNFETHVCGTRTGLCRTNRNGSGISRHVCEFCVAGATAWMLAYRCDIRARLLLD